MDGIVAAQLFSMYKQISDMGKDPRNFALHAFNQLWGNTTGGFGGIGGAAMTTQKTFVFTPIDEGDCLVFFNGKFAYSAPATEKFIEDVANGCVEGVHGASKYRGGV